MVIANLESFTAKADQFTLQSFLNCYLREYARPQQQLAFMRQVKQENWPLSLRNMWRKCSGYVLKVNLPLQQQQILLLVDSDNAQLNLRYLSACYLGFTPKIATTDEVIEVLIQELCLHFKQPFNQELKEQVCNSREFLITLLATKPACQYISTVRDSYLHSEQQMALGHAFHPAPKARLGFSEQQLIAHSPEFGANFQLHYFAVNKAFIQQQAINNCSASAIINADLPQNVSLKNSQQAIACHPWQAQYIKQLPQIEALLANGEIKDLGPLGKTFYATSSVRTLYSPNSQYFYKGSLHVRLTNCLRKNALYELETAMMLSAILSKESELKQQVSDLVLLLEPAYITVNLSLADAEKNKAVQEAFAVIFRENIDNILSSDQHAKVAGSLFSENPFGPDRVRTLIAQYARNSNQSFYQAALAWFSSYAAKLTTSVLFAYFERGIIFEPHLQNVLIACKDDFPSKIVMRDMEGTKLVKGHKIVRQLDSLSASAQKAIFYSADKGWQRISYCLFINNLCQCIFYISGGDPILSRELWAKLGEILQDYLNRYPNKLAQQKISALLQGENLPNKGNLLIRVQKQPDKAADYVPFINPIIAPLADQSTNAALAKQAV